ncbi:hypothetical protein L596_021093 [Steinernema carpocapsae]|uniref:RRM domain-containing protein n=1 Tax=Steinernema carpocapsae TaxID=34508 RepID=A0A4U5MVH7_STECR|nr:hypothetical protein L596_021093 [Steinernema carpocapsae]
MMESSEFRDGRYYLPVSLFKTGEDRTLQIGPWRLHDAEYITNPLFRVPMRNVVFVGGVPRTLRAVDIAHIFDRIYGPVVEAGVDTDLEHHYPKGAARITFVERSSYIRAISDRCIYISHCGTERLIDIKPYVLDDVPAMSVSATTATAKTRNSTVRTSNACSITVRLAGTTCTACCQSVRSTSQ